MKKVFLLIIISSVISFSQTVFESSTSDVYDFLYRQAAKGTIKMNDVILPLSRISIKEMLTQVSEKDTLLSELDKEELKYHLTDFALENEIQTGDDSSKIVFFGNDESETERFFSYSSELLKVNFSPILGFKYGKKNDDTYRHRWNGVNLYGYLNNNIGFSFYFRDNQEKGEKIALSKLFSPEKGANIYKKDINVIEYSEVRTSINYNWNWGTVSIGKDNLTWGYGKSGQLVLSDKAPSYPYIRLDLDLADWLKFNYFHAFLSSDVIDSNEVYASRREGRDRIIYRSKYLASHTLTVTPLEGLDISLGESIIYSDRLEISYFMPLMFFRLADHYLSRTNNNAGDNSQFFLGVSSRNHIKNTHLYGTLFIDEITFSHLFDVKKQRNQLGFTLGGMITSLPVDNLDITLEYTKIYPFVYRHYIATQTYENASSSLGHWMGHNSDLIYASLTYRPVTGMKAKLWFQKTRKGEDGLVDWQYQQPQPPFLFGERTTDTFTGMNINYRIFRNLYAEADLCLRKTETSVNSAKKDLTDFYFSLYYGL